MWTNGINVDGSSLGKGCWVNIVYSLICGWSRKIFESRTPQESQTVIRHLVFSPFVRFFFLMSNFRSATVRQAHSAWMRFWNVQCVWSSDSEHLPMESLDESSRSMFQNALQHPMHYWVLIITISNSEALSRFQPEALTHSSMPLSDYPTCSLSIAIEKNERFS